MEPIDVNTLTIIDRLKSVPKCLEYRGEHGTSVCVSMHCERCQALREFMGDERLTQDTVPYSDNPSIERGTD